MAAIDLKNCIISFKSGVSGGNTAGIDIKVGEGNVSWSESRNVEYKLEKGSLTGSTVRLGDDVPVDVSLAFTWEWVTNSVLGTGAATSSAQASTLAISALDASMHVASIASLYRPSDSNVAASLNTGNFPPVPTPIDALKRRGYAEQWPSSEISTDPCSPYAIDIWIRNTPPCQTAASEEFYILHHFRYEKLDFDLRAGTISCTGKCKAVEAEAIRTIFNTNYPSLSASGAHMGYNIV